METEKKQIIHTIFKDKCPICNQEIKGTSEDSVNWNIETHMRAAHPSQKQNAKA